MELLVTADGKTRRLQVKKHENLMVVLLRNGLDISHPCRGRGKCGKCKVKVQPWDGITDTPADTKEQNGSKELACLVKVERSLAVYAPVKWNEQHKEGKKSKHSVEKEETPTQKPAIVSDAIGKTAMQPLHSHRHSFNLSEQLLRDQPSLTLPFQRVCVRVRPETNTQGHSRWDQLVSAFHGRDKEVLQQSMEQALPALHTSISPTDGLVTLIRTNRAFIGLTPGDTATRRMGVVILCESGTLSGLLVDVAVPAVLSCANMPCAPAGELHAVSALLVHLRESAGIVAEDVTDVVMAGEVSFLHRISGFAWEAGPQKDPMPMFLGVRRLSAGSLGLTAVGNAGVWMAPAASIEDGSNLVVRDLAPYWVPVVAEAWKQSGTIGRHQGQDQTLRGLSGLLGCLLHREIRKDAKRRARHPKKSGKQA